MDYRGDYGDDYHEDYRGQDYRDSSAVYASRARSPNIYKRVTWREPPEEHRQPQVGVAGVSCLYKNAMKRQRQLSVLT